jgi:hypothetical protein
MGHSTPVRFRASEVKRAFRSLVEAGMRIERVIIRDGKVEFISGGQTATPINAMWEEATAEN